MQYRKLKELSENELLHIINLWDNGATLEEIRRRMRISKRAISKVLNFNEDHSLLDFTKFNKSFKKTRTYIRIIMENEITGLEHIEFSPFLLEALQGYGKTQMIHYLFTLGYRFYLKEYVPEYEKRSRGWLSIRAIITNSFDYLFDNFPQADVVFTAIDDADILHGRPLTAENQAVIERFWDIRHIQEKLYKQKRGMVTNILASHVPTSLMKKLRISAKYKVYKNIFTDKQENDDLRMKIGSRAFNFLECVYHWRTISPIFSKFYVLEVGNQIMFGKFKMVKTKYPTFYIKQEVPQSKIEQQRTALALRILGYEKLLRKHKLGNLVRQNPYTYFLIKEVLQLPGNKRAFGNSMKNILNEIEEIYSQKIENLILEKEEKKKSYLKQQKNEEQIEESI